MAGEQLTVPTDAELHAMVYGGTAEGLGSTVVEQLLKTGETEFALPRQITDLTTYTPPSGDE